ncbi:MAG: hypothetical protein P1P84_10670 [Deferrisomatales bacterium]|nr:hypothetical protein [Deferrisomatales bacterium]
MIDWVLSFFQTVGQVQEVHTVVDYYGYIKGLEYLICVGFFVGFPIFWRYINSSDKHAAG